MRTNSGGLDCGGGEPACGKRKRATRSIWQESVLQIFLCQKSDESLDSFSLSIVPCFHYGYHGLYLEDRICLCLYPRSGTAQSGHLEKGRASEAVRMPGRLQRLLVQRSAAWMADSRAFTPCKSRKETKTRHSSLALRVFCFSYCRCLCSGWDI